MIEVRYQFIKIQELLCNELELKRTEISVFLYYSQPEYERKQRKENMWCDKS